MSSTVAQSNPRYPIVMYVAGGLSLGGHFALVISNGIPLHAAVIGLFLALVLFTAAICINLVRTSANHDPMMDALRGALFALLLVLALVIQCVPKVITTDISGSPTSVIALLLAFGPVAAFTLKVVRCTLRVLKSDKER